MADVTEISEYDDFADGWMEDTGEIETRLLWHLLRQLEQGEVLFRLSDSYTDLGGDSNTFIGLVDDETEDGIRFTDVTPALKIAEHAYHIHTLGTEATQLDRAGWIDERLGEHRAVFEDRPTLGDQWVPKSEINRIVKLQS